jgi:hypothetical protein
MMFILFQCSGILPEAPTLPAVLLGLDGYPLAA